MRDRFVYDVVEQMKVTALLVLYSAALVYSGPIRSGSRDRLLYNLTSHPVSAHLDQDLLFTTDVISGPLATNSDRDGLVDGRCHDGDEWYSVGESFVLHYDPCQQCKCTAHGMECATTVCPLISDSCIEVERDPHECCVECVKEGCTVANETFHVGEEIRTSPCRKCKCETDGRAYCTIADCQPPRCVDHVIEPGSCCPECPRGPNCFAMGSVIPAGQAVVIPRRCIRCTCLESGLGERYWLGSHQARCHVIEDCRMDVMERARLRRSSRRYFNDYVKIEKPS